MLSSRYPECHVLFTVMLSVIVWNVIVMLNVVMLNVVVPTCISLKFVVRHFVNTNPEQ